MAHAYSIREAKREDLVRWGELRFALWPWDDPPIHARDAEQMYFGGDPHRLALVATDEKGSIAGFAEAAIRHDYVEGCETSPVGFLEGVYVAPDHRNSGIAARLADTVAGWAREQGCREFASNALLDNTDSHAFHAAIGMIETERVVFFKRDL